MVYSFQKEVRKVADSELEGAIGVLMKRAMYHEAQAKKLREVAAELRTLGNGALDEAAEVSQGDLGSVSQREAVYRVFREVAPSGLTSPEVQERARLRGKDMSLNAIRSHMSRAKKQGLMRKRGTRYYWVAQEDGKTVSSES
jgi:hypothetical protein